MTTYRELLQQTKTEINELDAREAQDVADAHWIDVREADEWQEGHLPGAVHVPLAQLAARAAELLGDDRPLVVHCQGGSRSSIAAAYLQPLLREVGRPAAHNLVGGYGEWARRGMPVDGGAKPGA